MTETDRLNDMISTMTRLMNRLHWAANGGLNTATHRATAAEMKAEMRHAVAVIQDANSRVARLRKADPSFTAFGLIEIDPAA